MATVSRDGCPEPNNCRILDVKNFSSLPTILNGSIEMPFGAGRELNTFEARDTACAHDDSGRRLAIRGLLFEQVVDECINALWQ